jgi:hypothetical protein
MNSKGMGYVSRFKTQYFGLILHTDTEIVSNHDENNHYCGSRVVMTLVELKGIVVETATMYEAYNLLDEMIDVFLELEIGLMLTDLGFGYNKQESHFYATRP